MSRLRSPDPAEAVDVIVIGSGAGGTAVAHALVERGLRVLMVEKGRQVGIAADQPDRRLWLDRHGRPFRPTEYENLGGKTKWYGAALLRLTPAEFQADPGFACPAWPLGYDELAPRYAEAERLLGVTTFANEPGLQRILDGLCRKASPWRWQALPLALRREILDDDLARRSFDGQPSPYKYDGETLLDRIADRPGFGLLTGRTVVRLCHAEGDPRRISGVVLDGGEVRLARRVVLAAGALNSPRLLQNHVAACRLENELPSVRAIGANLKLHLNTGIFALSPVRQQDVLCKTAMLLHDRHPHSMVQCLGWLDVERLAGRLPSFVPARLVRQLRDRAFTFFVMTEDGSSLDNRVVSTGTGMPVLDYERHRLPAAEAEHRAITRAFRRRLLQIGLPSVAHPIDLSGTAHAVGTLVMGSDPATSVVDHEGRVHGMSGLHVADGSVLPRSGRANPALTIFAWGLHVGRTLLAEAVPATLRRMQA